MIWPLPQILATILKSIGYTLLMDTYLPLSRMSVATFGHQVQATYPRASFHCVHDCM